MTSGKSGFIHVPLRAVGFGLWPWHLLGWGQWPWQHLPSVESVLFPPELIQSKIYEVHEQWLQDCYNHPIMDKKTNTKIYFLGTDAALPECARHVCQAMDVLKPGLVLMDVCDMTVCNFTTMKNKLHQQGQSALWRRFYEENTSLNNHCRWDQYEVKGRRVAKCMLECGLIGPDLMKHFSKFGTPPYMSRLAALEQAQERKVRLKPVGPPRELMAQWIEQQKTSRKKRRGATEFVQMGPLAGVLREWSSTARESLTEQGYWKSSDERIFANAVYLWYMMMIPPGRAAEVRQLIWQIAGQEYVATALVKVEDFLINSVKDVCQGKEKGTGPVLVIMDRKHVESVRIQLQRPLQGPPRTKSQTSLSRERT